MTDSTSASIWASKLIAPLQKDGSVLIEMIAERCKKRFLHRSISVVDVYKRQVLVRAEEKILVVFRWGRE